MSQTLQNIPFNTQVALASDLEGLTPTKLVDASGNTVMDASCGTIYGSEQYIPFGTGILAPEIRARYDFVLGDDGGTYICGECGKIIFHSCGLVFCGDSYQGIEAPSFSGSYAYINCGIYSYGDMAACGLVIGECGYANSGSIVASENIACCGIMECYRGIHAYADYCGENIIAGPISLYSGIINFDGSYISFCGNSYPTQFIDYSFCGTNYKVLAFQV